MVLVGEGVVRWNNKRNMRSRVEGVKTRLAALLMRVRWMKKMKKKMKIKEKRRKGGGDGR